MYLKTVLQANILSIKAPAYTTVMCTIQCTFLRQHCFSPSHVPLCLSAVWPQKEEADMPDARRFHAAHLPLSHPGLGSVFELYVNPEPDLGFRGNGKCASCLPAFSALDGLLLQTERKPIVIPLINWLSAAHQLTLCGIITFFSMGT